MSVPGKRHISAVQHQPYEGYIDEFGDERVGVARNENMNSPRLGPRETPMLDPQRLARTLRTDPGIAAIFDDVDAAAADIAYRYAGCLCLDDAGSDPDCPYHYSL
jgi:hypothetical protein